MMFIILPIVLIFIYAVISHVANVFVANLCLFFLFIYFCVVFVNFFKKEAKQSGADNFSLEKSEDNNEKEKYNMSPYSGYNFEVGFAAEETIKFLKKEKTKILKRAKTRTNKNILTHEQRDIDVIDEILDSSPDTETSYGLGKIITVKNSKSKEINIRLLTEYDCKLKWFSMTYEKLNVEDPAYSSLLNIKLGESFNYKNLGRLIVTSEDASNTLLTKKPINKINDTDENIKILSKRFINNDGDDVLSIKVTTTLSENHEASPSMLFITKIDDDGVFEALRARIQERSY